MKRWHLVEKDPQNLPRHLWINLFASEADVHLSLSFAEGVGMFLFADGHHTLQQDSTWTSDNSAGRISELRYLTHCLEYLESFPGKMQSKGDRADDVKIP